MIDKLKQLKELDAHLDIIKMDKNAARRQVLTDEIQAELESIDIEFDDQTEAVKKTYSSIEAEIKAEIKEAGEGVKKSDLSYGAVWVKPRTTWDTVGLDKYAEDHPEIGKFRKTWESACRINKK